MPSQNERLFAALIFIISFFTSFVGPLVIWLLKRNESSFIDYYGKEYFNLFISYAIYLAAGYILLFLLIGFIILPVVGLANLIFKIIAAVKAYDGLEYRIPFILRIIH